MKSWLWRGILAVAIAFLALSGMQTSVFAQSPQKQQGIEGVWDVRVTVVQCDTGNVIRTGRAILMYIDGGSLTEITDNPLHPTGLGTWRHLRGQSYTAVDNNFMFNADRSFAGTIVVSRDIQLSTNANEYTATATSEIFDAADQLISTGCSTSTATRLE